MVFEWTPHWDYEQVDVSRCRASVRDEGRGIGNHQCTYRAKYDDKWCGIHRPEAMEERAAKRGPTAFERKMAAVEKRQEYVEGLERQVEELQAEVKQLRQAARETT